MQVGALGLGGLALADMLRLQAEGSSGGTTLKNKSVVLLFLAGGPSQLETFDPKPHGVDTSTSLAGHIPTKLSAIRFASYFPKLAELADRLTVVRSFQTHHAEHNGAHKQILTADLSVGDGKPIRQPGIGAVVARVAGPTTAAGIPSHAMIPPTTRYLQGANGFAGAYDSVVEGAQPAWLGKAFAPFETKVEMAGGKPRDKKKKSEEPANPLIDNLQPRVEDFRIESRMGLLKQLDQINRIVDASGTMEGADAFQQQAAELLLGGAARKALDLTREDPRTLAAYDTEHFRNYRCNDNSQFERNGPSIGISLGRQLLLARRLCEAGCRFVNVIHANWDFHARKGIPNMPEGMSVLAPPVDHAVAAFLRDVEARGLSDEILLVITGEFGRTPKLDKNLGRHHWPEICPLVFAGGGLRHGQVVGQSDKRGGRPASQPIRIDDLHATIMHAMFNVGAMRLDSSLPKQVQQRAQKGKRIEALFS